jgi:hypothetical protein
MWKNIKKSWKIFARDGDAWRLSKNINHRIHRIHRKKRKG